MLIPTRSVVPLFLLTLLFLVSSTAVGQPSNVKVDRPDLEIQLHLLMATNEAVERNMSPALDPVVKQLKSATNLNNYRLAATFTNRIKSGGSLEVKGVLPPEVFTPFANMSGFYELTLLQIRLGEGENQLVDIAKLRFGLRIPVVTGMNRAEGNTPATPVIGYEPVGLTTELGWREGTPSVVGTMTTSKAGQLLVLSSSLEISDCRVGCLLV
jgi:hypothetical protein